MFCILQNIPEMATNFALFSQKSWFKAPQVPNQIKVFVFKLQPVRVKIVVNH